ncbi:conjugal transfer pilus assembly protein TraK [Fluviicoccus keumensis]|uniref:Conjugal transfer pilus assembly protein TraK n=1 Tax=Fluviicoccus keumensis TaxID=1435465 RepID=A0A4Q7YGY5_9GAMM|nr:type-F conjugative transfer system secretin TraK [Fluviicoccus keumensis]RZU36762.1 conjugal transfer pilus assembly protein TraK [Fluviicoccus keumensis]
MIRHATALSLILMSSGLHAEGATPFKNADDIPPPGKPVAAVVPAVAPTVSRTPVTQSQKNKRSLTQPPVDKPPLKLEDGAALRQQVIKVSGNDNHVVTVSNTLVNRIATPFKSPSLLGSEGIDYKVVGQDIYVVFHADQPIGVFVREDESVNPNSPVASLTLVPKPVPGQNIALLFDKTPTAPREHKPEEPNSYQDGIRIALTDIVMGNIPDGYAEGSLSTGIARLGGLMLTPVKVYSGADRNIYQYAVENISDAVIDLNEPSFFHDGVRAVAFFPSVRLTPKASTTAYIMADTAEH